MLQKFAILLIFGFVGIVRCGEPLYAVPEPTFEVFSPKGLRVSIPDSRDVKSVQYIISFSKPVQKGDAGDLSHEVEQSEDGHWLYWNPDVSVNLNNIIYYRVIVKHRDLYWTKEGQYRVDKVISLNDNTILTSIDCPDEQGQIPLGAVPGYVDLEEKNLGKITGGGKSAYKSSYSMYKHSDAKPITRSHTSTTSGTFLIKPSGVVEATGFKTQSSYDSTRREGEQWQHYKSELSAQEIEELKRLHGPSFQHFTGYSDTYQPSTAGSARYEEKHFSKEMKSLHGTPLAYRSSYYESPQGASSSYQQSYFAKESSSSSHTKPLTFQHSLIETSPDSHPVGSGRYEERYYELNGGGSAQPLPVQQGTVIQKTEYQRQEKAIPLVVPQGQNVEYSRQESHRVITNGGLTKPRYPSPDIAAITTGQQKEVEFSSGNLQLVESPTFKSHYTGSIFTSSKSVKASTPEQCELVPHIDYRPSGDVLEVEKSVNKLTCLASLAEASLKEELRLVKQQNSELSRKFELLELEVKRLTEDCKCLEKVN